MDTVHDILDRAWTAHSAGQFDAALQDYIWLFDATSEPDTDVATLRLSYVLNAWAKLAEEHLPARQALVALRDRDTERLLAGGDSDDDRAILFNDIRLPTPIGRAHHRIPPAPCRRRLPQRRRAHAARVWP